MELVGTLKTIELFLYFWRFFQDYEKSLNSFWTGAFFPGEELKDLSFDPTPVSFLFLWRISQFRVGDQPG